MSWNNRIFKRDYAGQTLYEIHEAFYNNDGSIWGWTEEPVFGPDETIEELISSVKMIYDDAIKHLGDVLDYDSTPKSKADWEPEEDDETDSD